MHLLRHVTLVGSARSGARVGSFDAQDVDGQVVFIEVGGGRGGTTSIPHLQSLEGAFQSDADGCYVTISPGEGMR